MPTRALNGYAIVVCCLALMLLGGCANFLTPEVGALSRQDARITLEELGVRNAVWQTKDLKLTYSTSGTGSEFRFFARLDIDRRVSDSFNVIRSFYLKMSFVDDHGQVLETVDITPLFNLHSMIPREMTVSRKLVRPPDASSIVFNYYGVFRGAMPKVGDELDIFYFPFER